MTIGSELTKLKNAKSQIRKVIQRRKTGLTISHLLPQYPPYIDAIVDRTVVSDGMIDYSEDGTSVFTLPEDVTTIRDYAFYDYTALKYLVITSNTLVELQGTHAFKNTLIPTTGNIYVPASLLSTYKTATNWSKFADRIISGTAPAEVSTNLIQHEETAGGRTVSWINSLTIQDLTTDRRI